MVGNNRARTWWIEINENAKCFNDFKSILDKSDFYAYINHDKDVNEQGELKTPHFHIVVKYNNPRTFTAIQKDFEGAHIEISNNIVSNIKYLIHATAKSVSDGKYNYSPDEIITNNVDYVKQCLSQREIEPFDSNEIITYYEEGTTDILDFYLRFGSQINGSMVMIEKICSAYRLKKVNKQVEQQSDEEEELKEQAFEEDFF